MTKPILDVLAGKTPERVPIWLMRQAGRYLPEYRALREQAGSFLDLCLTPKFAAEVTLQPIKRFDLDAAILFADILLIPFALGQKLEFREGEGPVLEKLNEEKIGTLRFNEARLAPVMETLNIVKTELPEKTALIGFCGGLWTVAAYMIDGNSRGGFEQARLWAKQKPQAMKRLFDILLDVSDKYLSSQIEAGAEIVQIFESWAGLLSGDLFSEWIIDPTAKLVGRIKQKYPHIRVIGFPREAGNDYRHYAARTGIDALGIDQNLRLDYACKELQIIKPMQGNLKPELLVAGGEDMRMSAMAIMEKCGARHIFNLGHGVVPQTPPDHVAQLIELVHGYKVAA